MKKIILFLFISFSVFSQDFQVKQKNILPEIIIGSVILFFVLRPLWLWYFKIDENIKIQKEQLEELKKISELFSKKKSPEGD